MEFTDYIFMGLIAIGIVTAIGLLIGGKIDDHDDDDSIHGYGV